MSTSFPKNTSPMRRVVYSYWTKRSGGVRMSSWRTPFTTSNGCSATVVGSSWFRSGTTLTAVVSTTLHVSVTVNRSPMLTALRSVFHQHAMGSTSTSPGACGTGGRGAGAAFGRTGAAPGDEGAGGACTVCPVCPACPATPACRAPIMAMTTIPTLDLMYPSTELAQPPLAHELHERGFHFPSIQAHADDIEIRVARHRHDLFLPFFDPRRQPRELAS